MDRTSVVYHDAPYIDATIPTNIGTRLLVVYLIREKLGLPNLAGQGTRNYVINKAAVQDYDWDIFNAEVADAFDIEATEAARRADKSLGRTVSEDEALEML